MAEPESPFPNNHVVPSEARGDPPSSSPQKNSGLARIMELVLLLRSPDRVAKLEGGPLQDLLAEVIALYGVSTDRYLDGLLARLYTTGSKKLRLSQRREVFAFVTEAVKRGELSFRAHLPCLYAEPEAGLAASAAVEYACAMPLKDGDPLTGPKDLLRIFRREDWRPASRAGAFAGLLLLGDRRVCDLAWEARTELSLDELKEATSCHSGLLFAPVIEFALAWLETLPGDEADSTFGIVASWLERLLSGSRTDEVFEIERDFPLTESKEPIRVIHRWSVDGYAGVIAPRLREIASREPEPRVLPRVLHAWGLELDTEQLVVN